MRVFVDVQIQMKSCKQLSNLRTNFSSLTESHLRKNQIQLQMLLQRLLMLNLNVMKNSIKRHTSNSGAQTLTLPNNYLFLLCLINV